MQRLVGGVAMCGSCRVGVASCCLVYFCECV